MQSASGAQGLTPLSATPSPPVRSTSLSPIVRIAVGVLPPCAMPRKRGDPIRDRGHMHGPISADAGEPADVPAGVVPAGLVEAHGISGLEALDALNAPGLPTREAIPVGPLGPDAARGR